MKSIIVYVLLFSLAFFLVTCEYESPPTQNTQDLEKQIFNKKPKPGNNQTLEWIEFTGDLVGGQEVLGCCPNAGPTPEYTLSLTGPLPAGTYDGEIFMNFTGRQSPGAYLIKFWAGTLYLEIRGGVAHNDRRNKILTVIFTPDDTECEIWIDGTLTNTVPVDFILTRAKL